jgi:hypothetical protein
MVRRMLSLLLALVFVLVTGVTACGGGDDDCADETSDDEAAEAEATDDAPDDAADDATDDEAEATDAADDTVEPDDAAAPGGEGRPGAVATRLGSDRAFTGEGSEAFCEEVVDIQAGVDDGGAAHDDGTVADQLAAVTPPVEIAAEWTNLFTVHKALATDPSGETLAAMTQEQRDAWGMSGAVVAAYLGDVCGLDDGG